jgi:diaminohydroxyphosphoribosylaminopyrimidine deaminase/5-amino-6-(5-phosphoribosylamino)uracil reductase
VFDPAAPTLVATTDRSDPQRREAWRAAGAEVLMLDRAPANDGTGLVDLEALVADLGKRDVQGVLLEGGPTLAAGFVGSGLVDELVVYLAPLLLGGRAAPGALGGTGFAPVGAGVPLTIDDVERIGDDVRVEAHVHRDR